MASSASLATSLPTNITTNTTLTQAGGPYTGGWTYIASGATLTIEPGTVIKLEGGLVVNGRLLSEGTAEKPVTFTSIRDDTAGGDTNKDGSTTIPRAGDWPGIEFAGGSGGPGISKLLHTRVRYGGEWFSPYHSMVEVRCPCASSPEFIESTFSHSYTGAINVRSASPKIIDSEIVENAEDGIDASSPGAPEIRGNLIAHNRIGVFESVGEREHMSVKIDENTVESNTGNGIEVRAPVGTEDIETASVGNNVVLKNGGKAIVYEAFPNSTESSSLADDPVPSDITSNTVSENAQNGIWVGGEITESEEWAAPPYALVVFDNGLSIHKGATLTLKAGTVVKNEDRTIVANGVLNSEGTAESPVTITSVKDDSVAGDTNGDGAATAPAPGDWGAIEYPSATEVDLEFMDIRYAEVAFDLKYLDSMRVANSDFVYNEKAFEVEETDNNSPELAALDCVPPYLSFVNSENNWYGAFGPPAPDINISGAIGASLPEEYGPLFDAGASLAELDYSLYGTDNTIPFSIYSCSALDIPPVPVTPIHVLGIPLAPNFTDPEVEAGS